MKKIITVGLSPTLQKTIAFDSVVFDEVNRSKGYRIDASGKAINATRVLNQLDSNCVVSICPLGEENAFLFRNYAQKDKLSILEIQTKGRVRYCYTLLEQNIGRVTELVVSEPENVNQDESSYWDKIANKLLQELQTLLPNCKALLLAGSRPAFWPKDLYAKISKKVFSKNIPIMVDFRGEDLLRTLEICVPTIIKINEKEFSNTFNVPFPLLDEDLEQYLKEKSEFFQNIIIITRGHKDTIAVEKGSIYRQKVNVIKPVNTIGCGDSFNAGFLYEWLSTKDIHTALARGNWCAERNALNLRPGSIKSPYEEGEQLW